LLKEIYRLKYIWKKMTGVVNRISTGDRERSEPRRIGSGQIRLKTGSFPVAMRAADLIHGFVENG
jgi:hypothetical protein